MEVWRVLGRKAGRRRALEPAGAAR
jgi:hypothetical protein